MRRVSRSRDHLQVATATTILTPRRRRGLESIVTQYAGVLETKSPTRRSPHDMTAQLPPAERYLRAGMVGGRTAPIRDPFRCRGRTVGLLVLGRIGKASATRVNAFGLGSSITDGTPKPMSAYRYYPFSHRLWPKDADILIVARPAVPGTPISSMAELREAPVRDGVLINVARCSLVDERALIEAVRNKIILAAGLDVFENEPACRKKCPLRSKYGAVAACRRVVGQAFRADVRMRGLDLFSPGPTQPPNKSCFPRPQCVGIGERACKARRNIKPGIATAGGNWRCPRVTSVVSPLTM